MRTRNSAQVQQRLTSLSLFQLSGCQAAPLDLGHLVLLVALSRSRSRSKNARVRSIRGALKI